MNIVVLGAGAIGSLFGGLLSKENTVILVGRLAQKEVIEKKGLKLTGKTSRLVRLPIVDSIHDVTISIDLLLVTVKSYDTMHALKEAKSCITDQTMVLSLQNGLDNLEKIEKIIPRKNVLGGVTTHGAFLVQPGIVKHTGIGYTVIGELSGRKTERLHRLVSVFNRAGIHTRVTTHLMKDIWEKAIINSSINPLTTVFSCKNGYLLENPILERIVDNICLESTVVAQAQGIPVTSRMMLRKTKQVIYDTAENYSSMLQSFQQGKKTEIDSINGVIVYLGRKQRKDVSLNELLVSFISSLTSGNQ